jgi:hypothetical protein
MGRLSSGGEIAVPGVADRFAEGEAFWKIQQQCSVYLGFAMVSLRLDERRLLPATATEELWPLGLQG